MSLITSWQKPVEEYTLPDGTYVSVVYYEEIGKRIAIDKFHAKYREIKEYANDELIGSIMEKNPYYDPEYFDSLQQHICGD